MLKETVDQTRGRLWTAPHNRHPAETPLSPPRHTQCSGGAGRRRPDEPARSSARARAQGRTCRAPLGATRKSVAASCSPRPHQAEAQTHATAGLFGFRHGFPSPPWMCLGGSLGASPYDVDDDHRRRLARSAQSDVLPNIGAQGSDLDAVSLYRRRCWLRICSWRSSADPPDRVWTSRLGVAVSDLDENWCGGPPHWRPPKHHRYQRATGRTSSI